MAAPTPGPTPPLWPTPPALPPGISPFQRLLANSGHTPIHDALLRNLNLFDVHNLYAANIPLAIGPVAGLRLLGGYCDSYDLPPQPPPPRQQGPLAPCPNGPWSTVCVKPCEDVAPTAHIAGQRDICNACIVRQRGGRELVDTATLVPLFTDACHACSRALRAQYPNSVHTINHCVCVERETGWRCDACAGTVVAGIAQRGPPALDALFHVTRRWDWRSRTFVEGRQTGRRKRPACVRCKGKTFADPTTHSHALVRVCVFCSRPKF